MRRRFGLRTWHLMAAVGVAAVVLTLLRLGHAPVVAVAVVGTCIVVLAHSRYATAIARLRAEGGTVTRSVAVRVVLTSFVTAAAVIGLADLAFLVGLFGYFWVVALVVATSHWSPHEEQSHVAIGLVIGVGLALRVATWLTGPGKTADRAGSETADSTDGAPRF